MHTVEYNIFAWKMFTLERSYFNVILNYDLICSILRETALITSFTKQLLHILGRIIFFKSVILTAACKTIPCRAKMYNMTYNVQGSWAYSCQTVTVCVFNCCCKGVIVKI